MWNTRFFSSSNNNNTFIRIGVSPCSVFFCFTSNALIVQMDSIELGESNGMHIMNVQMNANSSW